MCEFGHEGSKLVKLKKSEALLGSRFFIYNWKDSTLKSLNRDFFYTKKITVGDTPDLNGDLGIYSYNKEFSYNNYYYNNYYYNNYYNNYNNYYNNNNYNNNNYNNNNYNNNNYLISSINKCYDTTVIHETGQRSKEIELLALLSLKDHNNKDFLKHFNERVEQAAKQFKIKVIPYQFGDGFPGLLL